MTTLLEPQSDFMTTIHAEMARQMSDSRDSIAQSGDIAVDIAEAIRRTGRLILLGMGGSHAVGRALEPSYRALGIEAVALPLSEQLDSPLPLDGWTAIVTSQSGESAEVLRWFSEGHAPKDAFGLTMEGTSSLAGIVPCLVGSQRIGNSLCRNPLSHRDTGIACRGASASRGRSRAGHRSYVTSHRARHAEGDQPFRECPHHRNLGPQPTRRGRGHRSGSDRVVAPALLQP